MIRKLLSVKKITAAVMASAILVTGLWNPVSADAASKSKKVAYRTYTAVDLEGKSKKVGSRYIGFDGLNYTVKLSAKKEAKTFGPTTAGSQISTNGVYAFYQNGEDKIVRTTLSTDKSVTILKDVSGEVTHVYGSSLFYQTSDEDGKTALTCYNTKKKTSKVINKDVDVKNISVAGKYMFYGYANKNKLVVRDCAKGKNTLVSLDKTSHVKTNGIEAIYFAYNEELETYEVTSYNIAKKENKVLTSVATFDTAAISDNLKTVVYQANGKYYKYDVKSGKTKVIKEAEYLKY
ncbi:MAG: hypothetical protein Q4E53_10720 [Eubacteriales bacterium]|nr:hypothetical protein [Eubacteriales bacterium]